MNMPVQDPPRPRLSTPLFVGLLIYWAGMMAFGIAAILAPSSDMARGIGIGLIPGMVMGFGIAFATVRVRPRA